ncbi:hypothetical protein HRbin02_01763 [Candidatus Calditenuaceae archaeon HR02]|nr:hypothetical protein HRbin02_01763 [Candidatus Calditenuaceae archaeon HR02]
MHYRISLKQKMSQINEGWLMLGDLVREMINSFLPDLLKWLEVMRPRIPIKLIKIYSTLTYSYTT